MSKTFKSMKSFESPSITSSPQYSPSPSITRSITTKRPKNGKNSTSSIHILAQQYLNRAKHVLQDDTNKFILQVEKLDNQLEQIKIPVVKSPDPEQAVKNVKGVLTKEWSFFAGNATPVGLNKYKAKDFILPELKSSKSCSRLGQGSIRTPRTSVMSWLANYATTQANNTHNTIETIDVDRTDKDYIRHEKLKEKIEGTLSAEKSDQSTLRSEFAVNLESVMYTDRDDSMGGSVSRRSEKKATMKLVRHGMYKVPEELYETIVRRKKILKEMKRGGKNIDKVLKVEEEPPKKKGGRSVSVLPKQLVSK